MMKSSVTIAVLASMAAAIPTQTLQKRAEPSEYPGEGGACTHEFKYLNFDMTNEADKAKVTKLHNAFCNEFSPLMKSALEWAEAEDRTLFSRYFVDDEDDDEVVSVFNMLWSEDDEGPTANIAEFIVDNNDWLGYCTSEDDNAPVESGGYTDVDEDDDLEKVHFCQAAFDLPTLSSISCDELEAFPSGNMDNLARVMLHEFTHFKKIGQDSKVESQIVDVKNEDGLTAYYPSRVHALATTEQDRGLTTSNADNYAWLAANGYFTDKCKKFFTNPPPYKADQPGDPEAPGCTAKRALNGSCPLHRPTIAGRDSRKATLPVYARQF